MEKRLFGITGRMSSAILLAFTLLLVSACGSAAENTGANASRENSGNSAANTEAGEDGKINVLTTIAQIAEPLSVIGGKRTNVQSLMGPGVDPHLYNATQSDILKLEGADVIFYNGLHLEANMLKAFEEMGKNKPVIAVGEAIAPEKLLQDETGAIDPHIWFDIDLWKEALHAATEQLKEIAPSDADYFEANKNAYFAELDALKQEAVEKMARIPEEKRVLVTAHDAFGYFGRMLDIEVVGLQGLSTEDEIGLSDIEDTIEILVKYQVPAVFVESSVNPNSINAVIEGAKKRGLNVKLGGELFSDAMGAAGTDEGTYLGMYRHNVNTIANALGGKEE